MSEAVPLTVKLPEEMNGADESDAASPATPGLDSLRAQVRRQMPMIHASSAFEDAKAHHVLFSKDRLRKLSNPMREYKDQYVVNLWKVYNHRYLRHRSAAKILNLVFYAAYVYVITYMLAHLPPPAVMLRHQEAVSDLLLGEEFDAETTHIFKNFDDIMTAEEMWQWAEGPLSAGLLVDGEADGNLAALLGTNWLLGPVRLRQERSTELSAKCQDKLSSSFGPDMGAQLTDRGVRCTTDWFEHNATAFLNLSQPLQSLGGRSFIDAFPEWYSEHAVANNASNKDEGFFCCSQSGCFKTPNDQQRAIKDDVDSEFEWACSVDLQNHTLHPNPPGAYRSSIKSDPTETANLWAKFRSFGNGGFHIDLPGNSSTFVRQLKALRELQFVDQFTRSLTFQFIILNGNKFSVGQDGLFSSTMGRDFDPTVIVGVDVNFVFSPSGHMKSYDRITSMQLRPLHFLGIGLSETDSIGSTGWLWGYAIVVLPVWMILQEFQKLNTVGFWLWIRSGWNVFEFLYIGAIYLFCAQIRTFIDEEERFLLQYRLNTTTEDYDLGIFSGDIPSQVDLTINTQYLFNDVLPLRATYTMMIKLLGIVCLVVVFKFFKYMRIFKSTSLLWDTLRLAAGQLLAYTAVMFWVIFAFSLCATLIWGRHSIGFQNIPSSMFQLVRLASGVGDVDYEELKRGDATMTPGIFLLFVGLVAILGMNLMIAIVTDFYEEARDTLRAYELDYTWIQNAFSGANKYEDFYRGKGLWNEPVTENVTGAIGEALQALRGTWKVKPVPVGCGPRAWNAEDKEVRALGESQSYPFILQRSSRVQLRYRIESHEHSPVHSESSQTADPVARASSIEHLVSSRSGDLQISAPERLVSPERPVSPERTSKVRKMKRTISEAVLTTSTTLSTVQRKAQSASSQHRRHMINSYSADLDQKIHDDSPHAEIPRQNEAPTLDLWMAASSLAQFRGIRYLELLQGKTSEQPSENGTDEEEIKLVPGDKVVLKTPAEGGMMGKILLEFVQYKPVRRASRADKQKICREIERAREGLHDLKVEFDNKRRQLVSAAVDKHVEHLRRTRDAGRKANTKDDLILLCPGCSSNKCDPCQARDQYVKRIAEAERLLQRLHKQRGELEGVERIMLFDVVDVDSWQKFRPLTVNQGHLGERLKEACVECVKRTAFRGSVDGEDNNEFRNKPDKHIITKSAVINVVTDSVLAGLERQLSDLSKQQKAAHKNTIKQEIDKIITEMAEEEENIKHSNMEAEEAMEKRSSNRWWNCCSSHHNVQAVKTHETMIYLRDHGQVALDLLVPNYDVAHPSVSAAMNRLMKKAQRIELCRDHTPLLEVQQSAEFELQIPASVQRWIIFRSISQLFSVSQIKSMLRYLLPIHFVTDHLFFHSSVEDDVEDFLEAKCIRAEARLSDAVKRSLKLQMAEFMSPEHSIALADFSYQLQYFVFKVKSRRFLARMRSWFHRTFENSCLRRCFVGLRIPMRRHYSQVEEEIAMNYLLTQYNDFIDRRRGSILGDEYDAGGVLLDQTTRMALDKTIESARREVEEAEGPDTDVVGYVDPTSYSGGAGDDDDVQPDAVQLQAKLAEVGALLQSVNRLHTTAKTGTAGEQPTLAGRSTTPPPRTRAPVTKPECRPTLNL